MTCGKRILISVVFTDRYIYLDSRNGTFTTCGSKTPYKGVPIVCGDCRRKEIQNEAKR